MNCTIAAKNVKAVAKAIQVLSKFGDELYIEGYRDKLSFRTVNSSRSAYACFEFDKGFFNKYELTVEEALDQGYSINCKTQAKSCLGIFRSLSQIDKTVQTCKMQVDIDDCRLVFKLYCKHGIVKTHHLNFEESDSIQAVYDMDDFESSIHVPARLLSESMNHFHYNTDEVTFDASPSAMTLENYVGDLVTAAANQSNMLCTKVTLAPDEFTEYNIQSSAKLTFCLKELRAISSFCDYTCQCLRMNFTAAGAPIVFAVRADNYRADFVLATINIGDDDEQLSNIASNPGASTADAFTTQPSLPPAVSQAGSMSLLTSENPSGINLDPPAYTNSQPVHSFGSIQSEHQSSIGSSLPTLGPKSGTVMTSRSDQHGVPSDSETMSNTSKGDKEEDDYDFVEASPPRNKRYRPLFDLDEASISSQPSQTL